MQRLITLLFLTLVAFAPAAFAATGQPSPDFSDSTSDAIPTSPQEVDPTKTQLTSPTQAPALAPGALFRTSNYFYRYRRDVAISTMLLFGQDLEDHKGPHFYGGIQHQFHDKNLRAFDAAVEIGSNETGLVSLSRRWNHSSSRFRPFHKFGLSVVIDPDDQLTTFLQLQHYLMRGGLGFEYSLGGSFSFRTEALGLVGTKSQQFGVTAVSVWGF